MADEVRLIDANALRLMKVAECAEHTIEFAAGWKACVEYCKNDAPAIEAKPVKHGRWKITENVLSYEGTFDFIECSKCGKGFLNNLCENNGADFVDVENDFLFCPFCGSKNRMDGDSDDQS